MVNSIFERNYNYKHQFINVLLFNRNFAKVGAKFAKFYRLPVRVLRVLIVISISAFFAVLLCQFNIE